VPQSTVLFLDRILLSADQSSASNCRTIRSPRARRSRHRNRLRVLNLLVRMPPPRSLHDRRFPPCSTYHLSWYFGDSSYGGGLTETLCRGDDLWGASRVEQYAGWRPRSPHCFSTRRPAPPEGPAAPAAGWRLRRGELEPGDEDKASQRLSSKK
jgi:hypothetical protein